MTTTPPINRDDKGINALKSSNTQPTSSAPTEEIMPYPAIHPEGSRESRARRPQQHRRQHSGDRRQKERREKQALVLLDTRLPHDQRTRSRRGSDRIRSRRPMNKKKGISFYI